ATDWLPGQDVVHFSGARDASILDAAQAQGVHTAALHPLMTFPRTLQDASVETTLRLLAGGSWALEAKDGSLGGKLTGMVTALAGHAITLKSSARIPYHIAAVFVSNYTVALAGAAIQLWETFGITQDEALPALLPLMRAAVESLDSAGLPAALTGPV